ncbi:hypothetical protein GH714_035703 [Hevea brasiliensis]|uniref:Myb/SANT-like domain-containing protein n=1 Tax=Hevea brasiliensis TaxID=3981 RepID=A0A6A6KS22_HEVBR|nr:hypothetical protein GH714_035703 [Hevea brasiliensis]
MDLSEIEHKRWLLQKIQYGMTTSRIFRAKVIENYDQLCLSLGNCDDASETIDAFPIQAGGAAVDAEDAFKNQSDNAKEKGKYISWTEEMDHCLTELLLEQVLLGNRLAKNFKAAAYTAALTVLNKKFALVLTKENIRNRLKTWRKQYGLVKELLSHSGFEWDERQKMVVSSDSKWNEYIKNFSELQIIVGNELGSRNCSGTGAKFVNPVQSYKDHAETPLNFMVDEEINDDSAGNDRQESTQWIWSRPSLSHSKQPDKRRLDSTQLSFYPKNLSKQPDKRRRVDEIMVELMSIIATNTGKIADALTENNNNVCLDEVFKMVQNIPGFDDDMIIDACEYLSSEESRARMFMKLDDRLRTLWLLKRLHGQGS